MKQVLSILIENEAGALSRVVGLFSARGYNIDALNVAPTEDASLSRMTITTTGDAWMIEQITKQLNKLIEVIKVIHLTELDHLERELMLVKIRTFTPHERAEVMRTVDIFRGHIIDMTDKMYTVSLVGDACKLHGFIQAIDKKNILELVRTGTAGMTRGDKIVKIPNASM